MSAIIGGSIFGNKTAFTIVGFKESSFISFLFEDLAGGGVEKKFETFINAARSRLFL